MHRLVLTLVVTIRSLASVSREGGGGILAEWKEFKTAFGKSYPNSSFDKAHRTIFRRNVNLTRKHNDRFKKGEETWSMNTTRFSDMTDEELRDFFPRAVEGMSATPFADSNGLIDGVLDGLNASVTRVKRQDWAFPFFSWIDFRPVVIRKKAKKYPTCIPPAAFAAVAAVEAAHAIKNYDIFDLSEQHVAECAGMGKGCGGGTLEDAFEAIEHSGVITTRRYLKRVKAGRRSCNSTSLKKRSKVRVASIERVPEQDEFLLGKIVRDIGPVAACFPIDTNFLQYGGGVYAPPPSFTASLMSCGLVVGYDYRIRTGVEAWIIKTNLGSDWGEGGIVRWRKNIDVPWNLAAYAWYPVME